ncbi:MAG: NAD(P)/FAD-dependent oxidoreductase [Solirubrobacterales bacterium]
MPSRRTKRGKERTPLSGDYDVIVCGASFAGLALARRLAGSGARTLVLDRYEIGERQTSACAAPTAWLEAIGVADSIRQTFEELVINTPHIRTRMRLPWTFSTFDYRELCDGLWAQCDAEFETATVNGRGSGAVARAATPISVETDRGTVAAPLVADCLGWKRVLDRSYKPPDAPLSRGLEVHPDGASQDLEIWIERAVVPAGYGWSFPAGEELRVGVGSFDPYHHVKDPTVELAERLEVPAVRYQGNWIPHRLRQGAANSIFFCGDSAGHCLPLTAEGIRTAFYFADACGAQLRSVIQGDADRTTALRRYADFNSAHRWKFEWMLRTQRLVPKVPPRLLAAALKGMSTDAFVRWSFRHYLQIAPPPSPAGVSSNTVSDHSAAPAPA